MCTCDFQTASVRVFAFSKGKTVFKRNNVKTLYAKHY